jgi:hypothetical protein
LVVVSIAGIVLQLLDLGNVGVSLAKTFVNPIENRILMAEGRTTILTTISAPLTSFAISLFLIDIFRLRRRPRDIWTYLGMTPLIGYIMINVMQSGRGSIWGVGAILVAYWVVEYCRTGSSLFNRLLRLKLRTLLSAVALVVTVLYYFFYIGYERHYSSMTFDRYVQEANIDSSSKTTTVLLDVVGDDMTIGIISGLGYYSHQLSALDSIVNAEIPVSGFGRNILEWPLYELSRINVDLRDNSNRVRLALDTTGEPVTGFQTGFNAPIADFGNIGSIIFVAAMAVVLGATFRSAASGLSEVTQLAAIWMFEGFIFSIQSFPTDIGHTMNHFLILYLLLIPYVTFRQSTGE